MADQRVRSGKVDVIGDRDQRRRPPFRVEPAGSVGQQQRLAAELAESRRSRPASHSHRRARNNGRGPETAPPAGPRSSPTTRRPAWPSTLGIWEARNVEIGDRDRVARLVGESAEARAEHDGERRQGVEAAALERARSAASGGGCIVAPREKSVRIGPFDPLRILRHNRDVDRNTERRREREAAHGASGKPARSAHDLAHGGAAVRRDGRGGKSAQSGADDHHAAGCSCNGKQRRPFLRSSVDMCPLIGATTRARPLLHAGALASGIYERAALLFDRPILHGAVGHMVVQQRRRFRPRCLRAGVKPAATCTASP